MPDTSSSSDLSSTETYELQDGQIIPTVFLETDTPRPQFLQNAPTYFPDLTGLENSKGKFL
ncbi:MAG: hypothetical protein LN364_03095 [Candidatus Thermoplasmatota archaeon]|nr:hypothetical protein [Candidatus Thermoplasmatota archaeon]